MSEFEQRYNEWKAGTLSYEDFVRWVGSHRFLVPAYVGERAGMSSAERYHAVETFDRSEPGTWGEVHMFYSTGKLTSDEYYTLLRAGSDDGA